MPRRCGRTGSLALIFLLCFTFGGMSRGAEPRAELEQPLPPTSSSSLLGCGSPPHPYFDKASEGMGLAHESISGASQGAAL